MRRCPVARRRHAASTVAFVILLGPSLITRTTTSPDKAADRTLTGRQMRRQAENCVGPRLPEPPGADVNAGCHGNVRRIEEFSVKDAPGFLILGPWVQSRRGRQPRVSFEDRCVATWCSVAAPRRGPLHPAAWLSGFHASPSITGLFESFSRFWPWLGSSHPARWRRAACCGLLDHSRRAVGATRTPATLPVNQPNRPATAPRTALCARSASPLLFRRRSWWRPLSCRRACSS